MNANLIESPISKLLTNSYLPYELHPIHYKNCWCLPHLGRIPKEHARLKDDFGLDAKRGDFSGVQSWVNADVKKVETWHEELQSDCKLPCLIFYRKLIMVVSRSRFHMVDTCCLSVISFRLQTTDTIQKNQLRRWSYVKLVNSHSAGFPVHISRCELKPGDCDDQIIQIHVTATTTWNWKNWKNWNNNILYTIETSNANFGFSPNLLDFYFASRPAQSLFLWSKNK